MRAIDHPLSAVSPSATCFADRLDCAIGRGIIKTGQRGFSALFFVESKDERHLADYWGWQRREVKRGRFA